MCAGRPEHEGTREPKPPIPEPRRPTSVHGSAPSVSGEHGPPCEGATGGATMTGRVHAPCRRGPPSASAPGPFGAAPDREDGARTATSASELPMTRCQIHGIAYDAEREVCPECAKGLALTGRATRHTLGRERGP